MGQGMEIKKKIINLPIENDFRDGKKIVIPDLAHYNPDCEEQGNLIIIIRLIEHEVFKLKKNQKYDLVMEKNILLSDALCGAYFKISHLDGRELVIKSNDVIKPNMEYVVEEEGLIKNNLERGDLIINFNVIFPDKLDNERKKYLGKLLPINEESHRLKNSKFVGEIKSLCCVGEKINLEEVNLEDENNQQRSNTHNFSSSSNEGVECVQQ